MIHYVFISNSLESFKISLWSLIQTIHYLAVYSLIFKYLDIVKFAFTIFKCILIVVREYIPQGFNFSKLLTSYYIPTNG